MTAKQKARELIDEFGKEKSIDIAETMRDVANEFAVELDDYKDVQFYEAVIIELKSL